MIKKKLQFNEDCKNKIYTLSTPMESSQTICPCDASILLSSDITRTEPKGSSSPICLSNGPISHTQGWNIELKNLREEEKSEWNKERFKVDMNKFKIDKKRFKKKKKLID